MNKQIDVTISVVNDEKVDILDFKTGRTIKTLSSLSDAENWCKENNLFIQETIYN